MLRLVRTGMLTPQTGDCGLRGCSELHGSTTNEYRDEARFIDQWANMTEEVNPATRLGLVTTRSTTLTYKRSHSGSKAQLTALYNEAATLCVTDSLPSTSKFIISIKNSHHLNNSTYSQQQNKRSKNQPSYLRTIWAQTTYVLTRSARTPSRHALQLYTFRLPAGKMSVRQYPTSRRVQQRTKN
ncbi:hypothetical protein FHG87_015718 [Trinorchestia longiramus]|nr:hypothetical protein FHG87_015718 [Trinorchestia longiramus]